MYRDLTGDPKAMRLVLQRGALRRDVIEHAIREGWVSLGTQERTATDRFYYVWRTAAGDARVFYVEVGELDMAYLEIQSADVDALARAAANVARDSVNVPVFSDAEALAWSQMARTPRQRAEAVYVASLSSPPSFDPAWVPPYERAASDPDPEVRRAALFAVGQAAWPELRPLVDRLAGDPDAAVRETAARLQGLMDKKRGAETPPLAPTEPPQRDEERKRETLPSATEKTRCVRRVLNSVSRERVIEHATAEGWIALGKREPTPTQPFQYVWRTAAGDAKVFYVEDEEFGMAYLEAQSAGRDALARVMAGVERDAARVPVFSDAEALAWSQTARTKEDRVAAVYVASLSSPPSFDPAWVPPYERAASDPDPEVRRAALFAVGQAAWPELRPLVDRLAGDPDAAVRETAARLQGLMDKKHGASALAVTA